MDSWQYFAIEIMGEVCIPCLYISCQVLDILQHAVRSLPVSGVVLDLSKARKHALGKKYYKVLLELLRVQFDLNTVCELIRLVSDGFLDSVTQLFIVDSLISSLFTTAF